MIERLYQSLFAELSAWCASMTGDKAEAEEIVQEAFLRAMAHRAVLEGLKPAQQRAWLYRTVKNIFLDRRRRARRMTSLDALEEQGFDLAAMDDEAVQAEIVSLLESLPDIEGTLFALRYLQGYNSSQIGRLFSLSPATVRSKLASARRRLKEMMGG